MRSVLQQGTLTTFSFTTKFHFSLKKEEECLTWCGSRKSVIKHTMLPGTSLLFPYGTEGKKQSTCHLCSVKRAAWK